MAEITATLVKTLREATNVSMMECKRALVEANGNIEQATKLLRERGIASAAKRAARSTNEGLVASASSADGRTASLVEVDCETDFVARNASFGAFVQDLACRALATDAPLADTTRDELTAKITEIGENLVIRRNTRFTVQGNGAVGAYVHQNGKVGVLLELGCEKASSTTSPQFEDLLRDLTLHVAFHNPPYMRPEDVPADVLAAERDIFAKQSADKPAQMIEKIVDGKVRKYYQEVCFLQQGFVKEPKLAIADLLKERAKALDDTFIIRRYLQYQVGV